jgi:hypothetical protein
MDPGVSFAGASSSVIRIPARSACAARVSQRMEPAIGMPIDSAWVACSSRNVTKPAHQANGTPCWPLM